MKSSELRSRFLNYFHRNGHQIVPSSSLVPHNDPTLLFTNAGMVQFKDIFLGRETRDYNRAVTAQRCVRAGGKHNDLENVGYTARHHTFFEMLGNFSFGDYFKREAINFAWEFLTIELKIPQDKLWVTVYADDKEAAEIWLTEIGIHPERFSKIGDKPGAKRYESDNFWTMGDVGPCGPCSEIFYDHGPAIPGGPPGSPDEDGDRYVEIWNLVFMQYERDAQGQLTALPHPSVDTGMGLERITAVMQNVHSNYDIDLFQNLIEAVAQKADIKDRSNPSLRVIADHIRSCSFLIADGILPGNEGRSYVLRRIIRRASRHGHRLGLTEPFFYTLVPHLVTEMGDAYPELRQSAQQIEQVLQREEIVFAETLEKGLRVLDKSLMDTRNKLIPGDLIFRLYDTYGFPVDLTADIAREQGLRLDMAAFDELMKAQREQARSASRFSTQSSKMPLITESTDFTGYLHCREKSRIIGMYQNQLEMDLLSEGDDAIIFLDKTPFYAESGGQVGDYGTLSTPQGTFEVYDTQRVQQAIAHIGKVIYGKFHNKEIVDAKINRPRRDAIARAHSATHLLHESLRQILGDHVQQKGSRVEPDRLRFDFSHSHPLEQHTLRQVEKLVTEQVLENSEVHTSIMSLEEAQKSGARALFGEKYADAVRVLEIGFSKELCGGTHVRATGGIGLFKIIGETGVAAGIRRIEAVTGNAALDQVWAIEDRDRKLASLLRSSPDEVEKQVSNLLEERRSLKLTIEDLQRKLTQQSLNDYLKQSHLIHGTHVLAIRIDGLENKALRELVDRFKQKLQPAVIVLASLQAPGKIALVAGVSKTLCEKIHAGKLISHVAQKIKGKGGGRPDMAQGGGSDESALDATLESIYQQIDADLI